MNDDTGLTVYDNTVGVKIGSKWTVMYGVPAGEEPRIELTCLRKRRTDPLRDDWIYEYSHKAAPYHNAIFPLIHGAPRNDREISLSDSCKLLYDYASWLLEDIPADTGIVFCLPMIKYQEGLEALKETLKRLPKGRIGIEFFGEAWAASFGTLPIYEAIGTQVLALNFGSSTLEVVFYSGLDMIDQAVWTFGGSDIDRRLVNAIEQAHRGSTATVDQARQIKERYKYDDNEAVWAELTKDGSLVEEYIAGNTIREIVDDYIARVSLKVREFLRFAKSKNEVAVNALQIEGKGYLTLVGGMINMPGFARAVYEKLADIGGISGRIEMSMPVDGVVAPAIGAWKVANLLERERVDKGVTSWSEIP